MNEDKVNLKAVPTWQLVEELSCRDGVERFDAEPYQEFPISVSGPAIALVIID